MKTNLIAPLAIVALCLAESLSAAVVLSDDFATLSVGAGTVNNTVVTVEGTGTNWLIANASLVSLQSVTSFSVDGNTIGNATDSIAAGEWTTLLGNGSYTNGTLTSQARDTGNATGPALQFNSSTVGNTAAGAPGNFGLFAFVFRVQPGVTINNLSASYQLGTATTGGVWDNNTAAGNGFTNVRILGIDSATDFRWQSSAQAVGAGAGPTVSIANANVISSLSSGNYVFLIEAGNKTTNQRYSIDTFSFSADVIPEPSTAVALLGGFGLLALFRRRIG